MKKNKEKGAGIKLLWIVLIIVGAILLDYFSGSNSSVGLSLSILIVIVLLVGIIIVFIKNKLD